MFESTSGDGGRQKRLLGRVVLALVACGLVAYGAAATAPRLFGYVPPRPRVIVQRQSRTRRVGRNGSAKAFLADSVGACKATCRSSINSTRTTMAI